MSVTAKRAPTTRTAPRLGIGAAHLAALGLTGQLPDAPDATITEQLDIARELNRLGVPAIVIRPALDQGGRWQHTGGSGGTGYRLPGKWQRSAADPANIDAWQPGDGLIMITGCGLDGLDVDQHDEANDGKASAAELAGVWPTVYGKAATPSNGTHDLVASLGVASRNGLRPGVDVKAGTADGEGRGFLFLAPTIRQSKIDKKVCLYRWTTPPDFAAIERDAPGDESGRELAEIVRAAHNGHGPKGDGSAVERGAKRDAVREFLTTGVDLDSLIAKGVPDGECQDDVLSRAVYKLRARGRSRAEAFAIWLAITERTTLTRPSEPWTKADFARHWRGAVKKLHETTETSNEDGDEDRYVDWSRFWARERVKVDWAVEPLIMRGQQGVIYSPAKVGKSLLALEIAAAISTGRAVLDSPAEDPLDVIYRDHENTEDDLFNRLRDLGYEPGDDLSRLHYSSLAPWLPLDTKAGGEELLAEVEATGAEIVVIDSYARAVEGEEDRADTVRALYRHTMAPLKRLGVTTIRLDNTGKDIAKGQRGSSAKVDDVDVVWELRSRGADALSLRRTHERRRYPGAVHLFLRRGGDPLRHSLDVLGVLDESREGRVERAMHLLAVLDVPASAGRDRACKALKEAGQSMRAEIVAEAVKRRKADAEEEPY